MTLLHKVIQMSASAEKGVSYRRTPPANGNPVKLLKFMAGFGVGGTEKQIVHLSTLLAQQNFDVSFGCLKRWGPLATVLDEANIPINEYHINRLYGYNAVKQQLKFADALRSQHVQIMHSYNFHANVFSVPAARLAGVPCVVASIRDLGTHLTARQSYVHKWVCRLADHILVNADAIRTWLLNQGLPGNRISVIRNGIDVSRYGHRSDGAALRDELGIPRGAPLVVMLARLNQGKGIEYFLVSAAMIGKQFPDAYFLSVGDAFIRKDSGGEDVWEVDREYRVRLQQMAVELGLGERIRFTGLRQDIPEILAAAAVSVLPSLSEGTSNTLLESLAARVPVVATKVGGTPEVIRDGQHGLLVPPQNAQAISDAVCLILKYPHSARRLGDYGRKHVVTNFSFSEMERKTSELYLELLARKSTTR